MINTHASTIPKIEEHTENGPCVSHQGFALGKGFKVLLCQCVDLVISEDGRRGTILQGGTEGCL